MNRDALERILERYRRNPNRLSPSSRAPGPGEIPSRRGPALPCQRTGDSHQPAFSYLNLLQGLQPQAARQTRMQSLYGHSRHVRGAPLILEEVERKLGIKSGESTPDLEFSLDTVNCLGACALAPIVR